VHDGTVLKYTGEQKDLVIPDGVKKIGERAFENCKSIVSLVIPEGVTDIGIGSFACCENLTAVTLPASLPFEYMCLWASFAGCANLARVDVNENSPFYSAKDGVLYDKTGTTLVLYPIGKGTSYVVPEGVTKIKDHAFWYYALTIKLYDANK
jgi:hypothetical protein